jgi:hypothetical protein
MIDAVVRTEIASTVRRSGMIWSLSTDVPDLPTVLVRGLPFADCFFVVALPLRAPEMRVCESAGVTAELSKRKPIRNATMCFPSLVTDRSFEVICPRLRKEIKWPVKLLVFWDG